MILRQFYPEAKLLSYTHRPDTAVVSIAYDCCIMNICVLIIYDICNLFNNKLIIDNIQQNKCIIRCATKRRFCWYKNVKMAKKCVYDSCIRERRYL